MGPNKASRLTLVAKAYLRLVRDFAQDHPFITLVLLATVTAHIAYVVWGQLTHPKEAPLVLGILVVAGYSGLLIGAVHAFVQGRRKGR